MLGVMAMRCLIVDDNAGFLAAATDLLEREGLTVVGVASTGDEALQRAQELCPELTLVDIDLGAESGFDVVRRLAQDGGPPASSVILISTYAENDFAELIEQSPAIGFLSKSDLSGKAIRAMLGERS
jgi:CheY-like chemotaxis protein